MGWNRAAGSVVVDDDDDNMVRYETLAVYSHCLLAGVAIMRYLSKGKDNERVNAEKGLLNATWNIIALMGKVFFMGVHKTRNIRKHRK
jgi:hypothetical protein